MASDIQEVQTFALFGGSETWQADDWTDSDDRIRGGKSQSYLSIDTSTNTAHFNGNLDIETLGGAGFASQRTTGDDWSWDLHEYDGIALEVDAERSDSKSYTLILKDTLLPLDPETGRDQATISWEFEFTPTSSTSTTSTSTSSTTTTDLTDSDSAHPKTTTSSSSASPDTTNEKTPPPSNKPNPTKTILIPFPAFSPTYRGRPVSSPTTTKTLNPYRLKRISLMSRSHFGAQSGPFSLYIRSISAYHRPRSRMQILLGSKVAMPLAVVVGTGVLWGGILGVGGLIGVVRGRL